MNVCQLSKFIWFLPDYNSVSEYQSSRDYIAPILFTVGRAQNEVNEDGFVVIEPTELLTSLSILGLL